MKKLLKNVFLIFILALFAPVFAKSLEQSEQKATSNPHKNKVFQVLPMKALSLGYFEGSLSAKELLKYGDTALGSFEGLDGELIGIDGKIYKTSQNGVAKEASLDEKIAYANIIFFEPDKSEKLGTISSIKELESNLMKFVNHNGKNNLFVAKIKGDFDLVLARNLSKQTPPYEPLIEAIRTSAEQKELKNISGQIVGFYYPEYFGELNLVGWHFHFISEQKNFGGHVLDLMAKKLEVSYHITPNYQLALPISERFSDMDFSKETQEELDQAERDKNLAK